MFIQTEETPNPATLKFMPGMIVLREGTAQFAASDDLSTAPLAQTIFNVGGVASVFFGHDFISVTKDADRQWPLLKPIVLGAIMDHFVCGMPVLNTAQAYVTTASDPLSQQIIDIIDTRVRPAVANDGGDIEFDRFEDGVVYLHMKGACAGCPSSSATLKNGIENMLKHFVPEVNEVRAV